MSPIMRKSNDNVNHSGDEVKGGPRRQDDVLDLIHGIMHLYRSRQYKVLRDGPHDITHMDSKVLHYFGRHPDATQSDLAEHSGRDKAQLARLIKGLRDRGLLAGHPDPQDRRNTQLSLTEDGKAVQRSLQTQARKVSANAVSGMTADEQTQLMTLLQRVQQNLSAP